MSASDFYRRVSLFAISILVIIAFIIFISFFEAWAKAYLVASFSFSLDPEGRLIAQTEDQSPGMILSTGINLAETLLKFLRVILWMALVVVIVRYLIQLIFSPWIRGKTQSEIASLIKSVISFIIYAIAFFIIIQQHYPNVQLAPLFTGSAIIGIVVGLALQETLGNLFAGIALQADQIFQVGDVVTISNRGTGVVESVSWRGIKIRTFQNKLLMISNSVLGKETIEVAPHNNLNSRLVYFSTTYDSSPAHTAKVVREAVRTVENVSQKVRPVVRIRNFGESGIEWEIKYWLENYSRYNETDAQIRQRLWYVFKREGIHFPFPTRTISIQRKQPILTYEEQADAVQEILGGIQIFAPLSQEDLEHLSAKSTRRIYAPGESIVRKGQEGGSMFVIVRGNVKVQLPLTEGTKTINELKAGDFFGEMSLLTGEPRSANVVAEDETEVLRISKDDLKPLFEKNPELLKTISEIVEQRRLLLLEENNDEQQEKSEISSGLLSSIKNFFGIR
jgi:small-conductance mechanosensitive channel